MVKDLIEKAVEKNKFLRNGSAPILAVPTHLERGVPTLMRGIYKDCSPMLAERYAMFGRWQSATHGHWLGIADMEEIWGDPSERILQGIKMMRQAGEEGWPNEASALFRPERLSLFACSDLTNEKIYLLWLDFEDEPEFWVYDSNGESRYKDLLVYLRAYLYDDLSAVGKSWRAQ